MAQSLHELRKKFEAQLNILISTKNHNTQTFTKLDYLCMIEKVKTAKAKETCKLPKEYKRLQKYDVVTVHDQEKLIVPVKEDNTVRFYVHTKEMFDIIHSTHISIGHRGRNRMIQEINPIYKNITREVILIYLNLCETCKKKHNVLKAVSMKSSDEINSRCFIDFIDMQHQADDKYKFILLYQDLQTKFVILRPLVTKNFKEVANELKEIFTIFGPPTVLNCSSGKEFAVELVEELWIIWDELKMLSPGISNQGSDEKTVQEIIRLLQKWLKSNNTSKWSNGIRFVQLMKNQTCDSILQCSPFEAMFKFRLKSAETFPDDLIDSSSVDVENSLHSREMSIVDDEEFNSQEPDIDVECTSSQVIKKRKASNSLNEDTNYNFERKKWEFLDLQMRLLSEEQKKKMEWHELEMNLAKEREKFEQELKIKEFNLLEDKHVTELDIFKRKAALELDLLKAKLGNNKF